MTKEQLKQLKEVSPVSVHFYEKCFDKYVNEALSDMLTNMFFECAKRLSELEKISRIDITITV